MHLRRQPDYEKKQKEQNKDLGLILQEHEGQAVLLSETNTQSETEDEDDNQGKTLLEEIDTILVRNYISLHFKKTFYIPQGN